MSQVEVLESAAVEAEAAPRDLLLKMYRDMVTIRKFEETVYDVYSRGIMPGLAHLYTGMEATAVGVCSALLPKDNVTSTHRGHGHLLAKGADPRPMFAELLGRATGYNKGKGGSMHITVMSLGMLGANGVVGGGIGIATGAALSAKVLGDGRVSISFFGDGAMNEGLYYESTNMAALWKLPVVYVLENNCYGEYTSCERSTAGSQTARAEAMGIPTRTVDGNDVLAVYGAARWAVAHARSGQGPAFVQCLTYRWRGHHMGDQGDTYGYRTQSEIEGWMQKCPIRRFRAYLVERANSDPAALDAIDADVQQLIDDAVEFAKNSPYPDPAEVLTDVYA
jgi:acetoin:2,6-dichlorophenolindophenol oxidoreductase subunit alpha